MPQPPAPSAPTSPAPDYARLVEPAVAAELELTHAQRAQIVQLLQERTEAQANPDQDQRDQQGAGNRCETRRVVNARAAAGL